MKTTIIVIIWICAFGVILTALNGNISAMGFAVCALGSNLSRLREYSQLRK
jgi:hypothetical protein